MAIGALNYPKETRQKLALQSQKWACDICGPIKNTLCKKKEEEVDENLTHISKDKEENKVTDKGETSKTTCKDTDDVNLKNSSTVTVKKDLEKEKEMSQNKLKKPKHKKDIDKKSLISTIDDIIIEDIEEYEDENTKNKSKVEENFSIENNKTPSIQRSMSTDPSGNMNFSEQLKRLRQIQFANNVQDDSITNKASAKDSKQDINPTSSFNTFSKPQEIASNSNEEYFTFKRHESFKEHEDLSESYFGREEAKNSNIKKGLASLNNSSLVKKSEIKENETIAPVGTSKKGIQYFNSSNETINQTHTVTDNKAFLNSQKTSSNRQSFEFDNQEYDLIKQNGNVINKEYDKDKDEIKQLYGVSNENIICLLDKIKEKTNVEIEFSEAINSLKQHSNIEEVNGAMNNELTSILEQTKSLSSEKMRLVAKNLSKLFSKEKLEKMKKKKQKAYKLYLLNHYTEAKYKRMTVFGLVLAVVLAFIVGVTFSESLQKSLSDLINSIPLDVEFN